MHNSMVATFFSNILVISFCNVKEYDPHDMQKSLGSVSLLSVLRISLVFVILISFSSITFNQDVHITN